MAQSHADSHDLDKLVRWSRALDSGQPAQFPVYAAFLVRPEDRCAHDAFRDFRSSFQNAGAEFQHLVIFGQHGVSRTALELLDLFGLSEESIPLLTLFSGPAAKGFYWTHLTKGGPAEAPAGASRRVDSGSDDTCRILLSRIENGAGDAGSGLHLESVPGLAGVSLGNSSMKDAVAEALRRASQPGLT